MNKLYFDNEYIRDVNSKFNYVSIINGSYTTAPSNSADIDNSDEENETLPSICVYASDNTKYKYKYANDGTNIYHPVRQIGEHWYKLVQFGTIGPDEFNNLKNN